jgi:hypothetical protein
MVLTYLVHHTHTLSTILTAHDTAYQWLKHFAYVHYGRLKWSEVDISLNHDAMASFSLRK